MLTFVIPTPGAIVTGGPEALHQLADAINRSGKARALTYYVGGKHPGVVSEYQTLYLNIEETTSLNHPGAVVILAEIYNPADYGSTQWAAKWIWWLSAERFFPFEQFQGFGHLFQSEFARRKWQTFGFSGLMLSDYIRARYFGQSGSAIKQKNLIAVNGSKGVLFAASLIEQCKDLEIVALKGMSSQQVCDCLDRAVVYLDFGWHPGRDRLPREAALRGCVVVTGIEGAANNPVDIPIASEYKINPGNPAAVAALLRSICDQPDLHRMRQAPYVQAIEMQPGLFDAEVDTLIELSRRSTGLGVSHDNRHIAAGLDHALLEQEYLLRTYRRVSNDLAFDACFAGKINSRIQKKTLPSTSDILISVVVCSIDPDKLAAVRRNYVDLMQEQSWEFIHIPDATSLCEGYNRGFAQARGQYLVFSHDDIEILNEDFAEVVVQALQQADIVGVAGTTQLPGPAWSRSLPQTRAGQVAHPRHDGRVQLEIYGVHQALATGMQAVDGVLICVRRAVFEQVSFDEKTFDGFHLYDVDFCFAAYKAGFRLAVSNRIFLVHASIGNFDAVWQDYAKRFRRKWAGAYSPQPDVPVKARFELYATSEELRCAFARNLALAEHGRSLVDTRCSYDIYREKTTLQELDAELLAERMVKTWPTRPLITLLTVVRQSELVALVKTLDSLQAQFYKQWHLIILSDLPCPDPAFLQTDVLGWLQLDTIDDADLLVTAYNQILSEVESEWSALLPPGVCFEPDALISVADYGHLHPEWQLIYTDDDRLQTDGSPVLPRFKPDFCPDFFLASDYMSPTVFVRWKALSRVGGYLPQGGAEIFDLSLRVYEMLGSKVIGHIAKPLLHLPESFFAADVSAARLIAVKAHFERLEITAQVSEGLALQTLRITYALASEALVSIVIPFHNGFGWLKPCVQSIFSRTQYAAFELILVDHRSDDPDLAVWLLELKKEYGNRVSLIAYDGDFNLAHAWNLGAAEAKGDYLVLLHSDVQIVQPDWLHNLIGHAQRPDIGIVGPKLVFPESGLLQNGGTVLGFGPTGCAPQQNFALQEAGYLNVLMSEQNYSVITGACLAMRTALFRELKGLDAEHFPTLHADADLSLRALAAGYRNLWTPAAVLVHLEGQTRREQEQDIEFKMQIIMAERRQLLSFHKQWREVIAHDPAYNRHLTLGKGSPFDIETELTVQWDNSFHDRPRVAGQQMAGGVGEFRYFRPLRALMLAGRMQSTLIQTEKYNSGRLLTLAELERLDPDIYMRHAWTSQSDVDWQRLYRACAPEVRYVFQMDDLITHLPSEHPNFKSIPRDARYRLRQLLALGDAMVVSTEPLAELARGMVGEVHLVPNMLATEKWGGLISHRRQGDKLRVGWAGAQQHKGDLALIQDVVKATANDVDWIFFGMCPANLKPFVREEHDFITDLEAYPAKLATLNLDLAIAPLEIHPFNEAKSNLRLLEYGAMGWPVICTDILPYQTSNPPVTRLPNQPQLWINAIRERVAQPDILAVEGDALRAWVWRHFKLEDHLDLWYRAITGKA